MLAIFAQINTSKQWTTLSAFVNKVNQKLKQNNPKVTVREAASILLSADQNELKKYGIWVTSFGPKFMPIVITNPAHYRFYQSLQSVSDETDRNNIIIECTCSARPTIAQKNMEKDRRFYESQDYNAGRHSTSQSSHVVNCLLWAPPTTGHLHSWRRGYDDEGKKNAG